MNLYALEVFANDTLSFSTDLFLDNTVTWSVSSQVITLDFNEIFNNTNVNIGILNASLIPITQQNIQVNGANNFTLKLMANNYQTATMMNGSINPAERTLIIQTVFNSNTGIINHANNMYFRIKNTQI